VVVYDAYVVSRLRLGSARRASAENDFAFHALPRISPHHRHFGAMRRALGGGRRWPVRDGQNPDSQESKAFSCHVRAGRRARPTTAQLAGRHADLQVALDEDEVLAEYPKQTPP
jgi:hypothetical protein